MLYRKAEALRCSSGIVYVFPRPNVDPVEQYPRIEKGV